MKCPQCRGPVKEELDTCNRANGYLWTSSANSEIELLTLELKESNGISYARLKTLEKKIKEVQGLRRDLALSQDRYNVAFDTISRLARELAQAKEQIASNKEDAERYRWLKANHLQTGQDSWIRTGNDLEEAVDTGMAQERKGK